MPDHRVTGECSPCVRPTAQFVVRRVHARRPPREVAPVRSRKLALVIAPFLLLSLLPGVATAAQPKDTKAAHHAKVVKYWTPERIKNAKPRDFVFDPAKGTLQARREARAAAAAAATSPVPRGPVRGDILKGTGRVLFTLGGGDYICSGSVVAESEHRPVDRPHRGPLRQRERRRRPWRRTGCSSRRSTPPRSYTCANTQYGCWVADAIFGDTAFLNAGGFNDTRPSSTTGRSRS